MPSRMSLIQVCLLLEALVLLCIPNPSIALSANYSVVQFPSEVVAITGDNVTLKCAFSIQAGQTASDKGAMSWFKGQQGAESTVDRGNRYTFSYPDTFLSPGEGSLVISNVSLEDAGNYTCQVMVWGQGEIRGNGINLQVYARPSHPIIFLQLQSEPKPSWTLVCRTDGFYPAPVQLVWSLSGLKLTSSQQNCTDSSGFPQASSLLDLPNPHQRASYTCSVEHPSLTEPLRVHYESQLQAYLAPSVIEILNLLKIGTIFSITIGLLAPVCASLCKKHPRASPVGHATGSSQVLGFPHQRNLLRERQM